MKNSEEKLETSYFSDYNTHKEYEDNRVVTHNVVKYYGDKDTKFTVEVYDKNGNPVKGADVRLVIKQWQ